MVLGVQILWIFQISYFEYLKYFQGNCVAECCVAAKIAAQLFGNNGAKIFLYKVY